MAAGSIPRGMTGGAALLVLGALLSAAVLRACDGDPLPVSPTFVQVDTAAAAAWRARSVVLERELGEATGHVNRLRRRLEGVERRSPRTITVYDTVVDLRRDTVILTVQADAGGQLTLDVATPDSGGHRPETHRGASLADCDEGWSIRGKDVICDRARLGHLRLFARAGVAMAYPELAGAPRLELGARWVPNYRSGWAIEARATGLQGGMFTIERQMPIW